ncbi:GNAT family N-acetyltransferase [Hymenobacter sp. RP-2-7]|uniref:GNAT family N-acetyltransferase n=1 Tax=Hymenobacter polaris TaxID=2682546 RepID=A0A7Y0AI36_9BACT|nr:GNAT family N-acetyltransferase [Hymenobacter polaris]NML67607.1 GNAT family N-acetyltransferase [Hymenobacter polaris]
MEKQFTFTELPVTIDSEVVTSVYLQAHHASEPQPVALLKLELDPEGNPGWIGPLFVVENWRSCGLGSKLLAQAFELARRAGLKTVGLSVNRKNEGAQRLYERLGFLPYITGQEGYKQLIKVL